MHLNEICVTCRWIPPRRELRTAFKDTTSFFRTGIGDHDVACFRDSRVRKEGAVLFAEISAPPMNLLGPELVRDLVSLIQRAEADDAGRGWMESKPGERSRPGCASCRSFERARRVASSSFEPNRGLAT